MNVACIDQTNKCTAYKLDQPALYSLVPVVQFTRRIDLTQHAAVLTKRSECMPLVKFNNNNNNNCRPNVPLLHFYGLVLNIALLIHLT
jgi:hypothetical protein